MKTAIILTGTIIVLLFVAACGKNNTVGDASRIALQKASLAVSDGNGTTNTNVTTYNCTDSDGGQNKYVYGQVSINGIVKASDSCSQNTVNEKYCPSSGSSVAATISLACTGSTICEGGRCINATGTNMTNESCTDSDGGLNMNITGNITGIDYGIPFIYRDQCYTNTILSEQYCLVTNGDPNPATEYITCPYICSEGKCVVNQTNNGSSNQSS